jgi:hypothetical protein
VKEAVPLMYRNLSVLQIFKEGDGKNRTACATTT